MKADIRGWKTGESEPTPPTRRHRGASYLRGYAVNLPLALAAWRRELILYRRVWTSTILSTLFDPILYLLALGFGFGSLLTEQVQGMPYLQFIGTGLIASSIMYGAAYEAAWNSYVRIFVERSYEAMMATPAELEDVVAGEALWGATRSVLHATLMLAVLLAFGLLDSWWALLIPPIALLGGLLFMILGLAYTVGREHLDQLTFFFTLGVTPLYLFSGIFFPVETLPGIVQTLVWLSPLYHVVEVVRPLALGVPTFQVMGHLAWLLVVLAVLWGLPAHILRRRLRH